MKTGLHPTTPLSPSKERFLILICLILGLIVIVPILKRFAALRIFLDIFITAIYISMVYTVSHKKRHIYIGALLAMVMLISLWLQYFQQNNLVFAIGRISGILFFIMVITNILTLIFKSEDVTIEVIYAAILVYLLMALMWSFVYVLLELINPASFNVALSLEQGSQNWQAHFQSWRPLSASFIWSSWLPGWWECMFRVSRDSWSNQRPPAELGV